MTNLAEFLKKNFMGATITVTVVYGGTITGEVIDGFDNFIGLRQANSVKTFVNTKYIVTFS